MREATLTVLLQMSYWGFWAPITPAITGPWLSPMRRRNRWKDSRLIESSMDIKAIANSTKMTTLCSSVRFSSLMGGKTKKRSTALDPIRYSPHLLPPPRNLRLLLPDSANPNPNPRPTFDPHLATLFLLVCSGLCWANVIWFPLCLVVVKI